MPIIDKVTPDAPTTDQKQASYAKHVRRASINMHQQMLRFHEEQYNALWTNRQGLTPQECLDALGSDAGEALLLLRSLSEFCNTAKADSITDTIKNELTVNPDGTITVGDPIA